VLEREVLFNAALKKAGSAITCSAEDIKNAGKSIKCWKKKA
jgi:hypothetical protein